MARATEFARVLALGEGRDASDQSRLLQASLGAVDAADKLRWEPASGSGGPETGAAQGLAGAAAVQWHRIEWEDFQPLLDWGVAVLAGAALWSWLYPVCFHKIFMWSGKLAWHLVPITLATVAGTFRIYQLNVLQKNLDQLRQENDRFQKSNEDLTASLGRQQSQIRNLGEEVSNMTKERNQLVEANRQLRSELDTLKDLNRNLATATAQYGEHNVDLDMMLRDMQRTLGEQRQLTYHQQEAALLRLKAKIDDDPDGEISEISALRVDNLLRDLQARANADVARPGTVRGTSTWMAFVVSMEQRLKHRAEAEAANLQPATTPSQQSARLRRNGSWSAGAGPALTARREPQGQAPASLPGRSLAAAASGGSYAGTQLPTSRSNSDAFNRRQEPRLIREAPTPQRAEPDAHSRTFTSPRTKDIHLVIEAGSEVGDTTPPPSASPRRQVKRPTFCRDSLDHLGIGRQPLSTASVETAAESRSAEAATAGNSLSLGTASHNSLDAFMVPRAFSGNSPSNASRTWHRNGTTPTASSTDSSLEEVTAQLEFHLRRGVGRRPDEVMAPARAETPPKRSAVWRRMHGENGEEVHTPRSMWPQQRGAEAWRMKSSSRSDEAPLV